ncbi:MAG: ATP-binding protein [Gemmatimonadaceae bacterium]
MTTALLNHTVATSQQDRESAPPPSAWRSAVAAILRVPLLGKLIGANLILLLGALVTHRLYPAKTPDTLEFAIPLLLGFAVTAFLAWLALRPVAELEAIAERVARGDFSARVVPSPVADRELLRLSTTLNRLLERVETDRARIQYLAGRSVRARDIERESVARELRDSFAQMVSAIALQLAAAQRVNNNPEVEQQLERSRGMIVDLTDAMRGVAETLYPGTLGEFGLPNALRALARRTEQQSVVKVELDTEGFAARQLPPQAASALYRAADEALRNIAQHADARHARLVLRSDDREVTLEAEDDGRGIDMRTRDPLQAGLGLFSARAVLALSGGSLQISSAPNLGTHVTARVPITPNKPS